MTHWLYLATLESEWCVILTLSSTASCAAEIDEFVKCAEVREAMDEASYEDEHPYHKLAKCASVRQGSERCVEQVSSVTILCTHL